VSANNDRIEHSRRSLWIGVAGWVVLVLSAGAAILPWVRPDHGAAIIGTLLVAAGIAEIFAGVFRRETRKLAMLAGAVTSIAGLLFATDPATKFLPTLIIIMGWLFVRSLILASAALLEHGSVRFWSVLSAATDFILALFLAVGISIATLIVSLFGPTPPLVATFAWILALSFVATGTLLLEVASCARREMV
jgi:uncharacterized membrane protein HdeD (DUF308 family)